MQNAIDRDYVISHLMDVNLLISHYMFNFRKERKKSEKITYCKIRWNLCLSNPVFAEARKEPAEGFALLLVLK